MPTRFTTRPATAADAPILARHRAEMFRDMGELAEEMYEPLVAASRRYFEHAIRSGEYVAWFAAPADRPAEVVGGAGMQLRPALPRPGRHGREVTHGPQGLIVNVFTERPWRRRGVAELLMREIIAWARANGIRSLVLHASLEGRALYEKLGFVATNEMRYEGEL
jgi:GNAT superfamily N-acetyltransferase